MTEIQLLLFHPECKGLTKGFIFILVMTIIPCLHWSSPEDILFRSRTTGDHKLAKFVCTQGFKLMLLMHFGRLMLETSAFRISVQWSIYIINSLDKTKFSYKATFFTFQSSK